MKNQKLRQGLNISPNELRELVNELENQEETMRLQLGIKEYPKEELKFLVPIVNPTPNCSDTWEIEK